MKSFCQWLTVGIAAVALTGCATTNTNFDGPASEFHHWAFSQARTITLPRDVAGRLENGQVGDTIQLQSTEWGDNTQLTLTERYFAASGRPCFRGSIRSDSVAYTTAVICRYNDQQWQATRNVTDPAQQAREVNANDY